MAAVALIVSIVSALVALGAFGVAYRTLSLYREEVAILKAEHREKSIVELSAREVHVDRRGDLFNVGFTVANIGRATARHVMVWVVDDEEHGVCAPVVLRSRHLQANEREKVELQLVAASAPPRVFPKMEWRGAEGSRNYRLSDVEIKLREPD